MAEAGLFPLGDVTLQSGVVLRDARLAYRTYGQLDPSCSNVVVLPTYFTGSHESNEHLFGPGQAIDPAHHFIVSINMFGNGRSTSPSNAHPENAGIRFPGVTLFDNVSCQYRLVTEGLGVRHVALVTGWSMAGCQAYQWAVQYPDMVRAIVPFCASARTSIHNIVFLEGVKAALTADATWNGGAYRSIPERGLRAFGRVYAGWAFSQSFFREMLFRELGFETYEDLLVAWEQDHLQWDANDLLAKIWTWQHGDVSNNPMYNGDFHHALRSISAKCILIPCSTDLYFPPEDNGIEVAIIPNAELRTFESQWGHCVANPGNDPLFACHLETAFKDALGQ